MATTNQSPTDAIVFASYGTTRDDARVSCVDPVAQQVYDAFPDWVSMGAFTSAKVRRALDARGEHTPSVTEALHVLLALGVRRVVVQSGHVVAGHAYDEIGLALQKCGRLFDQVQVGLPLLSDGEDAFCVAEAVCERFPHQDDSALVLVGHGGGQEAEGLFAQLQQAARALGRRDVYVGSLRGAREQEQVQADIAAAGNARAIRLAPLMLSAGSHSHIDLAGTGSNSWASRFQAQGYEVETLQVGLGELPAVRQRFVEHARAAADAMAAQRS